MDDRREVSLSSQDHYIALALYLLDPPTEAGNEAEQRGTVT